MKKHFAILTSLSLFLFSVVSAHDGSQLWLQGLAPSATSTLEIANAELNQSWKGAAPVLKLNKSMKALPDGSFSITIQTGTPVIQSASEVGLLYGAYHLIRMQQTGANVRDTALVEQPSYNIRILNHWDNLNGTIERGYAGRSIFWRNSADQMRRNADGEVNEEDLLHPKDAPEIPSVDRLRDYARANASIGSNAYVAHGHRWPLHGRPARQGCTALVDSQGEGDLQAHSRLRRLPREGQLRRPAWPE